MTAYEECEQALVAMVEDTIVRFKPKVQSAYYETGYRFDLGNVVVTTIKDNYYTLHVKGRWSSWKSHSFGTLYPVGEAMTAIIQGHNTEVADARDAARLRALREISTAFKKAIDKLDKKRSAE